MPRPSDWFVDRWRDLFGRRVDSRNEPLKPFEAAQEPEGAPPSPRNTTLRRAAPLDPVVVGIDFGTSGTKVAWRDFADRDRTPVLLDFGTELAGYSRFSLPSVVTFGSRSAWVGSEALYASGHTVVWSPKTALLKGATRRGDCRGELDGIPSEELASALLVATAARAARAQIEYMSGSERTLLFNMDVPVSELDAQDTEAGGAVERFQRVLDQGVYLSRVLGPRPSLEQAVDAWRAGLHTAPRGGDLLPEAQVVMQGLSQLGRLERDKLHAVLDIGAGTVDMGIFKVVQVADGKRMPFWAAATHPEGCDDLDHRLLELLGLPGEALPHVRSERLAVAAGLEPTSEIASRLQAGAIAESAAWLADRYQEPYSKLYGAAFLKQKNTDEWRVLKVALVGGGSLIPEIRERLMRSPRPWVTTQIEPVDFGGTLRCRVAGLSKQAPMVGEVPFLLPAVGLSYIRPELTEFVKPSDVADDDQRATHATGLYDYELGET